MKETIKKMIMRGERCVKVKVESRPESTKRRKKLLNREGKMALLQSQSEKKLKMIQMVQERKKEFLLERIDYQMKK